MSASKLHPNVWDGQEKSGGPFFKNDKPTSANAPDYKGRIYLAGVGWYWISGWVKDTRAGEMIQLLAQEMTDEQVEKYCKPKPQTGRKPATHLPANESRQIPHNGAENPDNDIPF